MGDARRVRWPATPLGKVRLAALVFGIGTVVSFVPQLNTNLSPRQLASGIVGLVALAAIFAVTYRRRRTEWVEVVLTGAVIFMAAVSFRDPFTTVGLCLAALTTQSLYGSLVQAIMRWVAVSIALPLVVIHTPVASAHISPAFAATVSGGLTASALITGMMRTLLSTLQRQEQTAARERRLAESGNRLLTTTDPDEVRAIGRYTGAELCRHAPGVGTLLLKIGPQSSVVVGSCGLSGVEPGMRYPTEWFAGVNPRSAGPHTEQIEELDPLVGRKRWRAVDVAAPDGYWLVLVGARRRVPDEMLDSFHTLAAQSSQAETRCGDHTMLVFQARHDSLTSLANRVEFIERLSAAMDASVTGADVALIVIDLDDFKLVNDTYGHAVGDQLLVTIADRLRQVAPARGLSARLGGDEFAVLVIGVDAAQRAPLVAQNVYEQLHEPARLGDATVYPRASIGVAVGEPQLTAGDLMRCADIAMYWAKARGKSRVDQYTPAQHGDLADLRRLEDYLAHAVERDEIVVYYQPLVEMDLRRCVGVEALARWQHPTRGLLPPTAFIPLAERTGQIAEIGAHVLRLACSQAARWVAQPGKEDLRLSVNVARRQLLDGNLASLVRQVLAETGLPAHLLTLELTESEAIEEETAIRQLREVAGLGVRISIDDFGTGQTSLASLSALPVHQLKIDRSFLVQRNDKRAEALLQLVISVGQILDVETVAEGVETEEQARHMHLARVPLAQGFLFAKPMTPTEFEVWHARTMTPQSPR